MNPLCRLLAVITASILLAASPVAAAGGAPRPGWESVDSPAGLAEPAQGETEVAVRGGYVYVVTGSVTRVCILTVLGQPLTETNLQPGCHRFRIASRGIYILRAGQSTFRITI